jgi:hypothetical protein
MEASFRIAGLEPSQVRRSYVRQAVTALSSGFQVLSQGGSKNAGRRIYEKEPTVGKLLKEWRKLFCGKLSRRLDLHQLFSNTLEVP